MPSTTDKLLLATVTAVSGTELTCTPDGSVGSVTAVDCCGAQAADRVVLEWHYTQLLAVAIVGGPHGVGADYITDSGVSQGWYYHLYASGRIHAFRTLIMATSTAGFVTATVALPCTMADTDYVIQVNPGIGNVSAAYDIYANRSASQAVITLYVSSTGGWLPTTGVSLTLDGFVDGAIPPSGDRLPDYTGSVMVVPSEAIQTLPTNDTSLLSDITVAPIPNDYGRIARNGSALTVS